ncbi:hypothetical protein [Halomarina rubra]|uniref:Small CPxCG-related zinc finger protein n=1 Tax=Halomarina rubra TaxID=2071873 RepID=A0ABD6B0H0_9EURY|nr:hypothetical protein [Halomarina rubra]
MTERRLARPARRYGVTCASCGDVLLIGERRKRRSGRHLCADCAGTDGDQLVECPGCGRVGLREQIEVCRDGHGYQ